MGVGLALVKWPLLPDAHTLPLYEGVPPRALDGSLDAATSDTVFSCSLVVLILAVVPWRYAWRNYVRAAGDRWR